MNRVRTLLILVLLTAAASAVRAAPTVLRLTPAAGDTLRAEELRRWGLFPDLPRAVSAVFLRTEAGGIVARIAEPGLGGPLVRERSIDAATFRAWTDALAAGRRPEPFAPPPPGAVWPERPLDPDAVAPPPLPPAPGDLRTGHAGDWVMRLNAGWKHCQTGFSEFFTDMAMVQMDIGYAVSDRVLPFFGFQTGFGDLTSELEAITGNGKSAVYAFELGLLLDLPLSDRTSVTLSGAGGYYMRSLRWGGDDFLTLYGTYDYGAALVRELSDWGGSAGVGLRRRLGDRVGPPVFLQAGVRVEAYGADPSLLYDPVSDIEIRAPDHDRWLTASIGFTFAL